MDGLEKQNKEEEKKTQNQQLTDQPMWLFYVSVVGALKVLQPAGISHGL